MGWIYIRITKYSQEYSIKIFVGANQIQQWLERRTFHLAALWCRETWYFLFRSGLNAGGQIYAPSRLHKAIGWQLFCCWPIVGYVQQWVALSLWLMGHRFMSTSWNAKSYLDVSFFVWAFIGELRSVVCSKFYLLWLFKVFD